MKRILSIQLLIREKAVITKSTHCSYSHYFVLKSIVQIIYLGNGAHLLENHFHVQTYNELSMLYHQLTFQNRQ